MWHLPKYDLDIILLPHKCACTMGPTVIFDSWHSSFLAIAPDYSGLHPHIF